MENYSALCNAPRPFPKESICSWLTRLSLSQGVSLWAMLAYLELKLQIDFDYQFEKLNIDSISRKTGLLISDFQSHRTFFRSLRKFDFHSKRYLMRYQRNKRFRFCPLCLKEDEIPYFRTEWRFKLCVSCPIHKCLLEDSCDRCQNPICLPINLFSKVSDVRPLESLANCPSCGSKLQKISPAFFKGQLYEVMDLKSKHFIESGEYLLTKLHEGTHAITRQVRELESFFSRQCRNNKMQFKWTARTWRLKVKRHLKKYPSHDQDSC